LAIAVRTIEKECAAVPVGAYKLTSTNELRLNDDFKGLTIAEANDIKFYQHFEPPQTKEKKDLIARGEAVMKLDFTDALEKDYPKGSWSLHADPSKTMVTVRNLSWAGYLTYHRTNSNIFGYAYFGNGIKSIDLPFLLWWNIWNTYD